MQKFAVATAAAMAALVGLLLAGAPLALAQASGLDVPLSIPGPGWKTCPRCENLSHIADDRKKANVDTRQFDAHDISGVWGDNGIRLDLDTLPPFTPYGKKLFDATKSTVRGINSKDPINICDPLGYPRLFTYNYGIEFIQLPGRTLEFFDYGHTWRTIWTDGRKLPADPPVTRYLGYAVGRWEGDTFVIESTGFDERSWLADGVGVAYNKTKGEFEDIHGFPHSGDMKVVENYKRLDYGKLQSTLTIIDPKVYTKPWVTSGVATLRPNAELSEYFCVPSEQIAFNAKAIVPTTGAPKGTTLGH